MPCPSIVLTAVVVYSVVSVAALYVVVLAARFAARSSVVRTVVGTKFL